MNEIQIFINYFWMKFDKFCDKLTLINIISLLIIFVFVFGFIAGNITGTYLTSKYYIELVNITASQNNSVLELNNLEGNTFTYDVSFHSLNTVNFSNISIIAIGD